MSEENDKILDETDLSVSSKSGSYQKGASTDRRIVIASRPGFAINFQSERETVIIRMTGVDRSIVVNCFFTVELPGFHAPRRIGVVFSLRFFFSRFTVPTSIHGVTGVFLFCLPRESRMANLSIRSRSVRRLIKAFDKQSVLLPPDRSYFSRFESFGNGPLFTRFKCLYLVSVFRTLLSLRYETH